MTEERETSIIIDPTNSLIIRLRCRMLGVLPKEYLNNLIQRELREAEAELEAPARATKPKPNGSAQQRPLHERIHRILKDKGPLSVQDIVKQLKLTGGLPHSKDIPRYVSSLISGRLPSGLFVREARGKYRAGTVKP